MKERNFKKLGFFSALSICIGSIVGIGIFFKNSSISNNVNGDGTAWILSWVLSGIIALLVAIHFGKIAMIKNKGTTGLSSWAQRIATNKQNWFRHLVTVNYSFFYNSILSVILAFFTAEIFISFLGTINSDINVPMWGTSLIAIFLIGFYSVLNKISVKITGIHSTVTTILKFIPLLIAMIVGISLPGVHNAGGDNAFDPIIPNPNSGFDSFQGIMKALPAALFAFDAFVGVGSMSRKIKGGEKVVSKVIVTSMILVVVSYLLISLSAILHYNSSEKDGSIEQILHDVFGPELARGMSSFVMFFLFISASGTTNAIIGATMSEFENISISEKIFYSKQLNAKFGSKITSLIYYISSISFWILVAYIPAMIVNSDSFVDGLSNFPVLFFFIVYATLIFLYWKNIFMKNKELQGKKPWIYTTLVFISIIGVYLSMLLSIIFVIVSAINDPNGNSAWGFLFSNVPISNLVAAILHLVFASIFVLLPLVNYILFKIKNENNIFEDIDIELSNQLEITQKNLVIETRVIKL